MSNLSSSIRNAQSNYQKALAEKKSKEKVGRTGKCSKRLHH